ncbi:MAG: hypothetical protein ACLGPL_03835, partial [Acidobacteriota bacterium]
ISVINGIVHLEGTLQSEEDRETILQVLREEMRIEGVLDLMQRVVTCDDDVTECAGEPSEEGAEDYAM